MAIIRSGYRSPRDHQELQRFYSSTAWKRTRAVVLERAGGYCEFCNLPPDRGRPLDVVHLSRSTLELLRAGSPDLLDPGMLAAGHRRCHAGYSSGKIGPPII